MSDLVSHPWKDRTVLIVDDSPSILSELKALYSKIGMKVLGTALNGVDALDFLENHEVDFVSLDIIMPHMHGVECYRHISRRFPNVSCFFVSYLAREQSVVEAFADDIPSYLFLPKPINQNLLESRLSKFYELKSTHLTDEKIDSDRSAEPSPQVIRPLNQ